MGAVAVSPSGSHIQRVQHVSLPVPKTSESLDAARRFYGDVLRLEEIPRPPALPGTGIWYAVGDQELHLFSETAGAAVNAQSRRHPCFQVEDVDALRSELEAAGVTTRDD